MARQASDLRFALGDPGLDIHCRIKTAGLLPEQRGPRCVPVVALEKRKSANGICQVERRGLLMIAVDCQSFCVAGRGPFQLPLIAEDVSNMPDGVSHAERVVERSQEVHRFLIMVEGGTQIVQVSLDLSEAGESARQHGAFPGLAAQIDCGCEMTLGVVQPMFSARLMALGEQHLRNATHHGERVARGFWLFCSLFPSLR